MTSSLSLSHSTIGETGQEWGRDERGGEEGKAEGESEHYARTHALQHVTTAWIRTYHTYTHSLSLSHMRGKRIRCFSVASDSLSGRGAIYIYKGRTPCVRTRSESVYMENHGTACQAM